MTHIVHWAKFYPPEWGGMETVTHALAEGATRSGCQVSVIAFTRGAEPDGRSNGVDVVRCRARRTVASQPLSLRYVLKAAARARRADVVHIHYPNLLCALPLFAVRRRTRVILHWHSDIVDKGALGRIVAPIERWMARRADLILATSENYAASSPILGRYRNKVAVVPLGIDDVAQEDECALPADMAAFVRGRPYVLAVGRLVPYKGFDYLVDAASRLSRDIAVIIVGEGPCRNELEAKIRERGMADRVRITGSVSREILSSLFRNASAYVMSSVERSEAFGVVLLEAMAHRLPIIATDIPGSGVPWVAQDGVTGPLVSPKDAVALAKAIETLFRNPDAPGIYGRNSRLRFEDFFTREAMVSRVMSLSLGRPQADLAG